MFQQSFRITIYLVGFSTFVKAFLQRKRLQIDACARYLWCCRKWIVIILLSNNNYIENNPRNCYPSSISYFTETITNQSDFAAVLTKHNQHGSSKNEPFLGDALLLTLHDTEHHTPAWWCFSNFIVTDKICPILWPVQIHSTAMFVCVQRLPYWVDSEMC